MAHEDILLGASYRTQTLDGGRQKIVGEGRILVHDDYTDLELLLHWLLVADVGCSLA
ncbi:MAG: hypothetical protein IKY25_04520 [Alistipes sp.]|nr:hypothetical protein [Alistipes sp.]